MTKAIYRLPISSKLWIQLLYKCLDYQTTHSDKAKHSLDLKTIIKATANFQLANLHVAAAAKIGNAYVYCQDHAQHLCKKLVGLYEKFIGLYEK